MALRKKSPTVNSFSSLGNDPCGLPEAVVQYSNSAPKRQAGAGCGGKTSVPGFLRKTLQKLSADAGREEHLLQDIGGQRAAIGGDTMHGSPLETQAKVGYSRSDNYAFCGPDTHEVHGYTSQDHVYSKGVIMADLERYRASFSEELQLQLAAVQESLRQCDVCSIAKRFLEETRAARDREASVQKECAQLRDHCVELLRLNTCLRQQGISLVGTPFQGLPGQVADENREDKSSETLSAITNMSETLDGMAKNIESSVAHSVESLLRAELQPLKDVMEEVQTKVGQLENEVEIQKRRESVSEIIEKKRTTVRASMLSPFPPRNSTAGFKASQMIGKMSIMEGLSEEGENPEDPGEAMMQQLYEVLNSIDTRMMEKSDEDTLVITQAVLDVHSAVLELPDRTSKMIERHLKSVSEAQASMQRSLKQVKDSISHLESKESVKHSSSLAPDICSPHLLREVTGIAKTSDKSLAARMGETNSQLQKMPDLLHRSVSEHISKLLREMEESRKKVDTADVLRSVTEIEKRGNLLMDFRTGDITVKDIPFDPKNQKEEPKGEFDYGKESKAREILADVAEIWRLFPVPIHIEGHTKGADTPFWQQLATNRAQLIVNTLKTMGVDEEKMSSVGLPGKRGMNKVGVKVFLDIFPDR